jgi:hypothetical protein
MDPTFESVLNYINLVLLICFSAESALRLIALPVSDFTKDKLNIFDLVINVMGWVDIALSGTQFQFLRALIRAVKLLQLVAWCVPPACELRRLRLCAHHGLLDHHRRQLERRDVQLHGSP